MLAFPRIKSTMTYWSLLWLTLLVTKIPSPWRPEMDEFHIKHDANQFGFVFCAVRTEQAYRAICR